MRACDVDFPVVSSVVSQQISQSLDDIYLTNTSTSTTTPMNKTLTMPFSPSINQALLSPMNKSNLNNSFTSTPLQKFTFDYFSERLNANNYKDICRRRDEKEFQREETIMKLPIVEYDYLLMKETGGNSECLQDIERTFTIPCRNIDTTSATQNNEKWSSIHDD